MVVTGVSGGGRSTVARALENVGYYVVDNLPQALMLEMAELAAKAGGAARQTAMVLDVRSRAFSTDLAGAIRALRERGFEPRVVFVDADDEVLIRRFESVRRSHPLQGDGRLSDGIAAERALLAEAREQADVLIDTVHLNVNQLRARVEELFAGEALQAAGDRAVVRLQVRAAAGRRLRARRAVPAQPVLGAGAARADRAREAGERYVLGQRGASTFRRDVRPAGHRDRARLRARGQAVSDRRGRLHRRQAPQRGDRRGAGRPAARAAGRRHTPSTAIWGGSEFVAGGGVRRRARAGRLLAGAASQRSAPWRSPRWSPWLTTAAPAAGCARPRGAAARVTCARRWPRWPDRISSVSATPRCSSTGSPVTTPLAGHPVGNLVLCGLMELLGDPVVALDHAAAMVGAVGRVLPMACEPLGIEADLEERRQGDHVRGQHEVAVASGRVLEVRLDPAGAGGLSARRSTAIAEADWLIFGPGSWYTSVIPHLLVPELAAAIVASPARRLVTLNLAADNETSVCPCPTTWAPWPDTSRTSRSMLFLSTATSWETPNRLPVRQNRWVPGSCSLRWPSRTAPQTRSGPNGPSSGATLGHRSLST